MVCRRFACSGARGATALVLATFVVSGCTRTVDGTADAAATAATIAAAVPVADLLIDPALFPPRYAAVRLDPQSVDPVLRDVDGVVAGSVVTPPECTPPAPYPAPQYTAAVRGTDSQSSGILVVAVSRTDFPLRARRDQLIGCPTFTAVVGEARSTVTVTMLDPPPVDAEDSYAVDQTVTAGVSGSTSRTLSLVAQIGGVRVSASWLRAGTPEATPYAETDTEALDTLFTEAVLNVRRGGQP